MAAGHQFEYLPLIRCDKGIARFGRPPNSADITKANRENRERHTANLQASVEEVSTAWQEKRTQRENAGLPTIEAGIPLLLKIDPSLNLDQLRHFFDFEIVSEQEDGFVIVASEDISLASFQRKLADFSGSIEGSANVAGIHELREDPTQEERLRRILTDTLFVEWPSVIDTSLYIVEIGIACVGNWQITKKPKRGRLTDKTWAQKEAAWSQARAEAYNKWDELRDVRIEVVARNY